MAKIFPDGVRPNPHKMYIEVKQKFAPDADGKKRRQSALTTALGEFIGFIRISLSADTKLKTR